MTFDTREPCKWCLSILASKQVWVHPQKYLTPALFSACNQSVLQSPCPPFSVQMVHVRRTGSRNQAQKVNRSNLPQKCLSSLFSEHSLGPLPSPQILSLAWAAVPQARKRLRFEWLVLMTGFMKSIQSAFIASFFLRRLGRYTVPKTLLNTSLNALLVGTAGERELWFSRCDGLHRKTAVPRAGKTLAL